MTTETRYLCYSDAQPGEYPDPTYVCCGWCNNLPTTFSGYWGPCTDRVPGSGFCTRIGYPSVTTAITLTRTNICNFSWAYSSGNAAIGLFFKFGYPICSKTYMESTEFKNRWGVINAYLDVHFFAVPLRLIWDNFKRFMGEQKNPGDSIDFLTPKLTDLPARSFVPYSPFDYMGLPTNTTGIFKYVTAFHSRAINLIWNEYYRDQDLQNSRPVPTNDGPDNIDANLYQILPARNKRKDYFTSARPWPQKGPAVNIPSFTSSSIAITGSGTISLPTPTISKQKSRDLYLLTLKIRQELSELTLVEMKYEYRDWETDRKSVV